MANVPQMSLRPLRSDCFVQRLFSQIWCNVKLCVYRWDIVGVKVVSAVYHTTLRKELRNERFLSLCRTEKKILQSAIYCF